MLDLQETPCKPTPLLFLQCLSPTHCCALAEKDVALICLETLFSFLAVGLVPRYFTWVLPTLSAPLKGFIYTVIDCSVLWPAFWWASRGCVHVEELSFSCQNRLWTSWDVCIGVSEPQLRWGIAGCWGENSVTHPESPWKKVSVIPLT